jgi:hypothetical protein
MTSAECRGHAAKFKSQAAVAPPRERRCSQMFSAVVSMLAAEIAEENRDNTLHTPDRCATM